MEKKKKAPPATRVEAIVSQLRGAAKGRYVWRVQDKKTYAYCIEFTDFEGPEAAEWWEENRKRFPDYHANNELTRVHFKTESEWLMLKAADMLEELSG